MPMRVSTATKAALLVAILSGLVGCASGSGPGNSFAQMGGGATVAFDSIDGPPPHVFDRMVSLLDSETKLRNLPVVSREAPATYRVRSYLSAQIHRGRTTIAWVWDVYDRDRQRTLRLTGEEPGSKSSRDAWAAADDQILRRIAQAGLTGLTDIVNVGPAEPQGTPLPAGGPGPAIASAGDVIDPGSSALSFDVR